MAITDNILGDRNNAGFTSSIVTSKTYRDISLTFIHPVRGNMIISNDLEAIKNSIRNIVLTPIGSRPFFPEFGTSVPDLLFENFGFPTNIDLQNEIREGIIRWEPRLSAIDVEAEPLIDDNAYRIRVVFQPNFQGVSEIEFLLNRIR